MLSSAVTQNGRISAIAMTCCGRSERCCHRRTGRPVDSLRYKRPSPSRSSPSDVVLTRGTEPVGLFRPTSRVEGQVDIRISVLEKLGPPACLYVSDRSLARNPETPIGGITQTLLSPFPHRCSPLTLLAPATPAAVIKRRLLYDIRVMMTQPRPYILIGIYYMYSPRMERDDESLRQFVGDRTDLEKQASRHNRSISYSSVTDQPPNVCIPWFAASYAAFDVATFAEFAAIPTPSPSRS